MRPVDVIRLRVWIVLAASAAATVGLAGSATAQVAASLSIASDYRLRGVSLSDRNPVLALSVSDDLANGVYLGGSAIGAAPSGDGARLVGNMEYAGYAARLENGLTWDVGLDNQVFRVPTPTPLRLSYSEAHVGLSNGDVSARLYYSPNYLRPGLSIAYLEVGGVLRPTDDWRVAAHLGFFKPLAGTGGTTVRRERTDVRLDIVRRFRSGELGLGWAAASPAALPAPARSRGAFVLSATASF